MADRSLRGMRLGAQSLQSDEGVVLVDHQLRTYQTEKGERFIVTFAADAEAPEVWESPKTGDEGRLLDADGDETLKRCCRCASTICVSAAAPRIVSSANPPPVPRRPRAAAVKPPRA